MFGAPMLKSLSLYEGGGCGPSWMSEDDNYSNLYPPLLRPLYYIITAINHYLSCPHSPDQGPSRHQDQPHSHPTVQISTNHLNVNTGCVNSDIDSTPPSVKIARFKTIMRRKWGLSDWILLKVLLSDHSEPARMFLVVSSVRWGMACILCALV